MSESLIQQTKSACPSTPHFLDYHSVSFGVDTLVSGSEPSTSSTGIYVGPEIAGVISSSAFANSKEWLQSLSGPVREIELDIPLAFPFSLAEERFDRSVADNSLIRHLLDDYFLPIINLQSPVLHASQLILDGHIKRLPIERRMCAIMAAAIAAAHQARHNPRMHAVALIFRSWADEIAEPILTAQNGDALQFLMLLILYELVDPSRKLVWTLLGLACRMCDKLGWFLDSDVGRTSSASDLSIASPSDVSVDYPSSWRLRLAKLLIKWERYAREDTFCFV